MKKYRVFTNDRGKQNGVFMYSCFRNITATSAQQAETIVEKRWGPFAYRTDEHGPIKAIEWPAELPESIEWLAKHVGN